MLTPAQVDQINRKMDAPDDGLTGRIVLHCKNGRFLRVSVEHSEEAAHPDQEVVDLTEVASGRRRA